MINSTQLQMQDLSKMSFPQTWEVLEEGIQKEVAPGFVVGVWWVQSPLDFWAGCLGQRRKIPSPLPITVDTVFDFASVTKVFATASLAATLVERGWLDWETPLSSLFGDYPYSRIQISHLLSHTAGLVAWHPFWEKLRERFLPALLEKISVDQRQRAMQELVFEVTPQFLPGKQMIYSDLSFLLLGFALEKVTAMPLDQAVKKFVWEPMGIQEAFYRRLSSPRKPLDFVAATEDCPWRGGVLQGEVHDDNCWSMGGYGGHAGAFGTVRDLMHFSRSLMVGRFLSPKVLKKFWTRVSNPLGCTRTLGWDMSSGENSAMGGGFCTSFSRAFGICGDIALDRSRGRSGSFTFIQPSSSFSR